MSPYRQVHRGIQLSAREPIASSFWAYSFPVVAVRMVIVDDGKEFRSGVVTPQEAMTYGSLLKR